MASINITLPTQTLTTSAGATASNVWDVSDAIALSVSILSASTAPGGILQGAYSTESTATFYTIVHQTSGGSVIQTSSSISTILLAVPYKQLRGASSAVVATTYFFVGAKTIQA